jgi:cyclin-dependent kinase 8/11
MRPGDLPAKEGDVFAIKKFKPDKEGDVQTYAGISQSGAREIMVGGTILDSSMAILAA